MITKRFLIVFGILLPYLLFGQTHNVNISVHRHSARVLVLTEESPMENIIIALAGDNGIAVVDANNSPVTAAAMRKKIEEEFGRNDIQYLIDTHHHWDHASGNQIYKDAVIVAHANALTPMSEYFNNVRRTADRFGERWKTTKEALPKARDANQDTSDLLIAESFYARVYDGLSKDFQPTLPDLTFTDEITIELGGLTLNLIYFGSAHSGSDVFIHVEEEGLLLTGDVFLDRGWLPLFSNQRTLDIDRWIDVLNPLLDDDSGIETIIPAHRDIWPKSKLVRWHDYIVTLWEGIKSAKKEGLTLDAAKDRFPQGNQFEDLKTNGHTDAALARFHRENIEAFWRQLQ